MEAVRHAGGTQPRALMGGEDLAQVVDHPTVDAEEVVPHRMHVVVHPADVDDVQVKWHEAPAGRRHWRCPSG